MRKSSHTFFISTLTTTFCTGEKSTMLKGSLYLTKESSIFSCQLDGKKRNYQHHMDKEYNKTNNDDCIIAEIKIDTATLLFGLEKRVAAIAFFACVYYYFK